MPTWLLVSFVILCILIGMWILLIAAVSVALILLNRQIERSKSGINIVLAQKYDVTIVLAKYLLDMNVDISDEVKKEFNLEKKPSFDRFATLERLSIGQRIDEIVIEIFGKINEEELKSDPRIETLSNSIEDIDRQYKHIILSHNSRIWAYNYWIRFKPYAPIAKLFKLKAKSGIDINSKGENDK